MYFRSIPSGGTADQVVRVGDCKSQDGTTVNKLEHTELTIEISHPYRGDLTIDLVSPMGTTSQILTNRKNDDSSDGVSFTFMTVHNWGEDPSGEWILRVKDNPPAGTRRTNKGVLKSWSLTMYGTNKAEWKREPDVKKEKEEYAYKPKKPELKEIIKDETKDSNNLRIKGLDVKQLAPGDKSKRVSDKDQQTLDLLQDILGMDTHEAKRAYEILDRVSEKEKEERTIDSYANIEKSQQNKKSANDDADSAVEKLQDYYKSHQKIDPPPETVDLKPGHREKSKLQSPYDSPYQRSYEGQESQEIDLKSQDSSEISYESEKNRDASEIRDSNMRSYEDDSERSYAADSKDEEGRSFEDGEDEKFEDLVRVLKSLLEEEGGTKK